VKRCTNEENEGKMRFFTEIFMHILGWGYISYLHGKIVPNFSQSLPGWNPWGNNKHLGPINTAIAF
jgi:hypothetical protein